MKVKVAKYIADFLASHGIDTLFTVTGGGAMHLNDAFGHHPGLHCVYNHHEQASAIAAEGYTRLSGKLSAVCVTSGPGGTNAITGVLGGWLDSIPMFVISGQVKRETTVYATPLPLRQLGDQEYNIVASVRPMTKYAEIVLNPEDIRYHLEKALYLALSGRPGPVWLDIPLDVQGASVEIESLRGFNPDEEWEIKSKPQLSEATSAAIIQRLKSAERPVIFAGSAIRMSGSHDAFLKMLESLRIPVVTAWNAHDAIPDSHPLFCGRPGTVGTRGGNFVVQNADLLLVLGCRLNIRQISYNYRDFAPGAYKIVVDIDPLELQKPTISPDLPVNADVRDVIETLIDSGVQIDRPEWLDWCSAINRRYPACLPEYAESEILNPYLFIDRFSRLLRDDDAVVCGNGSACVIGFQAFNIKEQTRLFSNSGCAAMGYGFPAAIGAAVSRSGKRTVCIDGDGSFQMNLQELQTVVYNQLNLKIIYLNNNGYHSIRQTQTNLFQPPLVGVCDGNGLSFPDAEKIAWAYGIPYIHVTKEADIERLIEKMEEDGPIFAEIVVDPSQNFAPKLSSKVQPDGRITSPPLDDMFPFLPKEEYAANHPF